ncbi:MAG: hypothetical protein Q9206_004545 [Seirophora lacunosa]|nr:MAG: hypothetical protein LQ344_007195 [Seirophora lacunosa]
MEWHRYSGFVGKGVYVIINKASMTSLDMVEGSSEPGTKVQGHAHIPNNGAQLWRFHKASQGDVYAIENLRGGLVLTATGTWPSVHVALRTSELTLAAGTKEQIVGQAKPNPEETIRKTAVPYPREALWAVDSSLYSMEPGKMVLFRSVKYPGFVLDLQGGGMINGAPVRLAQESGISDAREMQQWLLHQQP